MAKQESVSVLLYRLQEHLQGISEIVRDLAGRAEVEECRGREFLNERQMAEYLGVTKRALEGRRYRGRFPDDVCVKIEGELLYSVSRYEAWIESMWPSKPAAAMKNEPKSRKRQLIHRGARSAARTLIE